MEQPSAYFIPKPDKSMSFTWMSRLTIFLSWIGIHRFYAGRYLSGTLLIGIFFTVLTYEQKMQGVETTPPVWLLLLQAMSFLIQLHDLFAVSFGQFKDPSGTPITLSIQEPVASNVQYGPLLVWACFAGVFGAHNFYAKKYKIGLLQLVTLGGLGIWALYDLFLITKGDFRDARNRRIAHIYAKDPHVDVIA